MNTDIRILDPVALLKDLPHKQLKRGQLSTIVKKLANDVFEIEFADRLGRAIAMLAVKAADLLQSHDELMIT